MAKAAGIAKAGTDFKVIFAGDFSPSELRNEIVNKYPVECLPWMSVAKVVDLMMDARAGMIVAHPIERYKTNYPVKTFEYMAAGMPVIASKFGESGAFVAEAQGGILVDPLNPNEIADAIKHILANPTEAAAMGQRGRQLVLEKYNWEHEAKRLIELYGRMFT